GLAMPYGQRGVFVGAASKAFVYKQVPRHGHHCSKYALILDPLPAKAIYHHPTRTLRVQTQVDTGRGMAGGGRRQRGRLALGDDTGVAVGRGYTAAKTGSAKAISSACGERKRRYGFTHSGPAQLRT